MTPDWQLQEYPGREGLLRLRDDWMRLFRAIPARGFQHAFETHLAYCDQLPSRHGPLVTVALTDGERIRAICPLEQGVVRILGRRTRVWGLPWGLGNVPRDIVASPSDAATRELLPRLLDLFRSQAGGPGWLVLDRMREDSTLWRSLESLDPRGYCTDQVGESALIDCDRSAEALNATLSKNLRSNLRYARNKLGALRDVRFQQVSDPPELAREFETFLRVEASGWKGAGGTGTALAFIPRPLAFYRQWIETLRDGGRCEINSLYAEGNCIASAFNVRVGAEYVLFKIAYDERYPQASPGRLLFEWMLQRCCADPEIKWFNVLTHPAWSDEWRPSIVRSHTAYIPLRSGTGRVMLSLLRRRLRYGPLVKRWLQRIRAGARSETPTPRGPPNPDRPTGPAPSRDR